jgi:hypothetical protein
VHRHIASAIAFALGIAAVPAAAQQFLGRVGGSCATLPASNQQAVPLDVTVPASATLIVTAAASSNFVSDLAIDDPIGSRYQALGGTHGGGAGVIVHFRTLLQRPLSAGDTLLLQYGNAGSNVQSCVSVLGFGGVPSGSIVQDALGAATGDSATLAVTATTASSAGQELVLSSFATNAAPGSVTAQAPANALAPLCSADTSLCLIDAYYSGAAVGTAGVALGLGNTVDWAGALTALYADGIFGNGFD